MNNRLFFSSSIPREDGRPCRHVLAIRSVPLVLYCGSGSIQRELAGAHHQQTSITFFSAFLKDVGA